MLESWLGNWPVLAGIAYIVSWLIVIVALFVVPINRKPTAAISWLMLIFLVPFLGLILFLIVGSPKLSKQRRAKQQSMDQFIGTAVTTLRGQENMKGLIDPHLDERYKQVANLTETLGGMPPMAGNKVDIKWDYPALVLWMAEAVDKAEKFVHVEFFCINRDPETEAFFVAMENAVKRGVVVRVLMDHWSSRLYPGYKDMCARMTEVGIDWHVMLPVHPFDREFSRLDLRNHRKLIVIDNKVGFTGSMNMIRRNYHRKDELYYDELVARIEGPAVAELDAVFRTDWYSETDVVLSRQTAPELSYTPVRHGDAVCQILPSGPGQVDENNLKVFSQMIYAAQKELVISTPYFVPDEGLMTALTSAAKRGVNVIVLNSEIGDQFGVFHAQHSYYEPLMEAGVKIYLYPKPILLHSKFFTVDDEMAVVGSSNMDIRSFQLDLEVSMVCFSKEVVAELKVAENEYLAKSKVVQLAEWKARPLSTKLFENLMRLTSALQ